MRAANSSVHLHVRAAQVSRPERVYHATRFGLDTCINASVYTGVQRRCRCTGQAATLDAQDVVAFKYLARQTLPGPTRPSSLTLLTCGQVQYSFKLYS